MKKKIKEIKSKVNIRKLTKGYIVEISDFCGWESQIAVTKRELEMIVLYGGIILKEK